MRRTVRSLVELRAGRLLERFEGRLWLGEPKDSDTTQSLAFLLILSLSIQVFAVGSIALLNGFSFGFWLLPAPFIGAVAVGLGCDSPEDFYAWWDKRPR